MNLVMIAKSKFMNLLKNKFKYDITKATKKHVIEMNRRKHEMFLNTVIDKCHTL